MRQVSLFLLFLFYIISTYNNVQSIFCYGCSTCNQTSNGTLYSGCNACATITTSSKTDKMCAETCSPGSYQGGYLFCCTSDYCNYNTPLNSSIISCYECSTCSSSLPGLLTSGCTSCGTTVYSAYTQKKCLLSCTPGENSYCCNSSYCNYNTPLSSKISCYECSTCSSSSPGSITTGCTSCGTAVYSTYTEKTCSSYCSPGRYNGGYLYCCNTSYCNYDIPTSSLISCYECSSCSSSYRGSSSTGCTSCANYVYSTHTQKKCVSSCSQGSYFGGYLYCCYSSYCNIGNQFLIYKTSLIGFPLFVIGLLIL